MNDSKNKLSPDGSPLPQGRAEQIASAICSSATAKERCRAKKKCTTSDCYDTEGVVENMLKSLKAKAFIEQERQ